MLSAISDAVFVFDTFSPIELRKLQLGCHYL